MDIETKKYIQKQIQDALYHLHEGTGTPQLDPAVALLKRGMYGGVSLKTGAGVIDTVMAVTKLVTTGANALTLADGTEGQFKTICMITDGGDGTLTPAHLRAGTTITFNDVGDSILLVFIASEWQIVANNGCTIA